MEQAELDNCLAQIVLGQPRHLVTPGPQQRDASSGWRWKFGQLFQHVWDTNSSLTNVKCDEHNNIPLNGVEVRGKGTHSRVAFLTIRHEQM